MIQPIFNPDDSERSSAYNTTQPKEDRELYGPMVSRLVAGVVAAMGTSADPRAYGESVAASASRTSCATSRHACRLRLCEAERQGTDRQRTGSDVLDRRNAALSDGLNRDAATGTLRPDFPYVAPPVSEEAATYRAA